MASVAKVLTGMAAGSFIGSSGAAYYVNNKVKNTALANAQAHAQDGKIKIGGMTKDGKMWDGAITVDEFKKNLNSKTIANSLVQGGLFTALAVTISAVTLLLRGKIPKVK